MTEQKQIITDDEGKWTAIIAEDTGTQIITEYKSRKGTVFARNRVNLTPDETLELWKFLNRYYISLQYEAKQIKEKEK